MGPRCHANSAAAHLAFHAIGTRHTGPVSAIDSGRPATSDSRRCGGRGVRAVRETSTRIGGKRTSACDRLSAS